MDESLIIELIQVAPSVLWFVLAVFVLYRYRQQIGDQLGRLSSIEALGVRLDCIREGIDAAVALARKSEKWQVDVPPEDERRVIARAKRSAAMFRGTQILWVDDMPANNVNERRMFTQLGCCIDQVTDTEDAVRHLRAPPEQYYELVISDIARGDDPAAGIEMLPRLRALGIEVPVILYVGVHDPSRGVPAHAFGVTNRPDRLLHLVIDILERTKS
jgi:CheY-like chemotaxis protein